MFSNTGPAYLSDHVNNQKWSATRNIVARICIVNMYIKRKQYIRKLTVIIFQCREQTVLK